MVLRTLQERVRQREGSVAMLLHVQERARRRWRIGESCLQ
jgi:hypothetical protein